MFGLVFNWIMGKGLDRLTDIYFKYKDSAVESERIQATWAKNQLDAMQAIREKTANFPEMRVLSFFIGFFFVTHLGFIWLDTMTTGTRFEFIGWQVAAFPSPINEWEGAILLSFYGITATTIGVNSIIKTVSRWWKK